MTISTNEAFLKIKSKTIREIQIAFFQTKVLESQSITQENLDRALEILDTGLSEKDIA